MAHKDWDAIATREFRAMDAAEQAEWGELRRRIS
jgi:hypothetical protein